MKPADGTTGSVTANRLRAAAVAAATALLMVCTVMVGSAAADTVGCGDVVTRDTTLSSDVGPCPGTGIIVAADGVTLDLGGHTVTGDPYARRAPDKAGIVLRRVSGVTVVNGTVERFDAGVLIRGGSGNTVRKVTARDNVNYRVVTGRDSRLEDIDPEKGPFCMLGDGIAVFNSSGNVVEHNEIVANGPYAGISLVSDSDDNTIAKNKIIDNDVLNLNPNGEDTICGGPPGVMSDGRTSMTVGVKVEGPGANRNLVEGNQVKRAGLAGIAVIGQLADMPNSGGNMIRHNRVTGTAAGIGGDPEKLGRHGAGIALMRSSAAQGAHGNTIVGNTSSRNFGDGIYLDTRGKLYGTVVRGNVVNHNGLDGIDVEGPGSPEGPNNKLTGNRGHGNGYRAAEVNEEYSIAGHGGVDGYDRSDGCVGNDWSRNRFGSVNQECVAAGGTGQVGGPGRSGDAEGARTGPLRRANPNDA